MLHGKCSRSTDFMKWHQLDENSSLLIPDEHHSIAGFNYCIQPNCSTNPIFYRAMVTPLNFFDVFFLQLQFGGLKGINTIEAR